MSAPAAISGPISTADGVSAGQLQLLLLEGLWRLRGPQRPHSA